MHSPDGQEELTLEESNNTSSGPEEFSIATVPTLIEQGITKYKVRISFVMSYASYSKMHSSYKTCSSIYIFVCVFWRIIMQLNWPLVRIEVSVALHSTPLHMHRVCSWPKSCRQAWRGSTVEEVMMILFLKLR